MTLFATIIDGKPLIAKFTCHSGFAQGPKLSGQDKLDLFAKYLIDGADVPEAAQRVGWQPEHGRRMLAAVLKKRP